MAGVATSLPGRLWFVLGILLVGCLVFFFFLLSSGSASGSCNVLLMSNSNGQALLTITIE